MCVCVCMYVRENIRVCIKWISKQIYKSSKDDHIESSYFYFVVDIAEFIIIIIFLFFWKYGAV